MKEETKENETSLTKVENEKHLINVEKNNEETIFKELLARKFPELLRHTFSDLVTKVNQ